MPAVVVRTRLMVQGASATDATQYRGFFDACQTMLRSEGIGAFYKGDGLLGSLNADTWPGGLGREDVGRSASGALLGPTDPLRIGGRSRT